MKRTTYVLLLFTTLGIATLLSCKKENDFYEVGKQPVTLTYPIQDTLVTINRAKMDSLYRFNWTTKRNFIDFNLLFSKDKSSINNAIKLPTGIKRDFYITGTDLDQILAGFDIQIGQKATLYWSVQVINPEAGWCDEVRTLNIVR
ncbi:SusE domain-containing protein [Sphingobacterium sp. SYP-B4668]|uniref:SusE domain-containing protein n=1 Tax=Sphingobacterium sp. SYP-B4668 TaxID=2996035 RepID=UPI0022DD544A|nr:SusE domain-containing protein [Sphingobacterium sp. SYP-B4668]